MADPNTSELSEPGIHVSLTHATLSASITMDRVRSPSAGAIVLFAGTTRDNFDSRAVLNLSYQSYVPLALQTMLSIARSVRAKHSLKGIAIVHRLGVVPVGEESVLIAVSSPHRKAAWLAGEECLEEVKARVEVWKLETFEDDDGGGVWRANRDGAVGVRVEAGDEAGGITSQLRGDGANGGVTEDTGPVTRPRRLGEKGHGAVVNPTPEAPRE
ncbi:Molybdopterin synthase catalytic subunit [Cytospora mali]|uniref:Molybdopterin synthase catalytic subunit n=1 Tax=Cytospora mali TaxID=578113 RepID=A0A194WAJ8_CYTMA|nr:Molybdopterin synthase catalytic subunit [Valsa mali]